MATQYNEPRKIGVIVAMDKEFAQLRTLLDEARAERQHRHDFVRGRMGHAEVVLQQCGVGKVNAAMGALEMINSYNPDLVVSTGCAGGASVQLSPLDVVVATECAYHDVYCGKEMEYGQVMGMPARFKAPKQLIGMAMQLGQSHPDLHVHSGLTVSGDWFVDSREKMQSILQRFPEAMAVDMESCAIAQACWTARVPFVSFRIISDVPLKDHEASQYFDFWNRMAEGSFEVTRQFLMGVARN